jgi:hypothetical protein
LFSPHHLFVESSNAEDFEDERIMQQVSQEWALTPKLSAPATRVRLDTRNIALMHWRHLAVVITLCSH